MATEISKVASKSLKHFAEVVHPQAVRIFTPFTNPVPLTSCKLSDNLRRFLVAYEPRIETAGLFPHQAEFLHAYAKGNTENCFITTATGSGKSLCFWSWVLDRLAKKPDATAILCFPTQALMWGQAERLARLSNAKQLVKHDESPYAGSIKYGKRAIGWSIWCGTRQDRVMKAHEESDAFVSARIRIATLDKAHFSLFRGERNKQFAKSLNSFVFDEAHSYDGVFGANVHYFLKRLYLASELLGQERPGVFLASATLCSARQFAATLLSLERPKDIVHIEDSTKQEIKLISAADVPKHLDAPPSDGLLRIILLLNGEDGEIGIPRFMDSEKQMGGKVNGIYFSESKFHSRMVKKGARSNGKRTYEIYDADLTPKQRREMERKLNDSAQQGITVLATNALELGVDIEGLDICLIDQIPPSRADLLQRIGRVGRRSNRPGLVLLGLTAKPHDQHILENPAAAFRLDLSRALPIPLHLQMLRWRHALAAFKEWMGDLKYRVVEWSAFNRALEHYFGFATAPQYQDLKKQFEDGYGTLVNMGERYWEHNGFRATASQGKIPLREGEREVARIEDIAIFRDAHPEGVYLCHDGCEYRIVDYECDWKIAQWEHPESDAVLGKWLTTVKAIKVKREPKLVTTRGLWRDDFKQYEIRPLPNRDGCPKNGRLEFGVWDFMRKWTDMTKSTLRRRKKEKSLLQK